MHFYHVSRNLFFDRFFRSLFFDRAFWRRGVLSQKRERESEEELKTQEDFLKLKLAASHWSRALIEGLGIK